MSSPSPDSAINDVEFSTRTRSLRTPKRTSDATETTESASISQKRLPIRNDVVTAPKADAVIIVSDKKSSMRKERVVERVTAGNDVGVVDETAPVRVSPRSGRQAKLATSNVIISDDEDARGFHDYNRSHKTALASPLTHDESDGVDDDGQCPLPGKLDTPRTDRSSGRSGSTVLTSPSLTPKLKLNLLLIDSNDTADALRRAAVTNAAMNVTDRRRSVHNEESQATTETRNGPTPRRRSSVADSRYSVAGYEGRTPFYDVPHDLPRTYHLQQRFWIRWVLWPRSMQYHETTIRSTDDCLRVLNMQITMLSATSVILMALYNIHCFVHETLTFNETTELCPIGTVYRFGNIFINILGVSRIYLYYHCRAYQRMVEWEMTTKWKAFVESNLRFHFAIEVIIALWMPIPGLEWVFGMGHKVVIIMFVLRMYLIFRTLRDHSTVYTGRHLIKTQFEATHAGQQAEFTIGTVLKTHFYKHTMTTLITLFISGVMVLGYFIYILEREFYYPAVNNIHQEPIPAINYPLMSPDEQSLYAPSPFAKYINCVWMVAVTATTVGYGDVVPMQIRGRFISVLSALMGIITTSLLVSVLTNRLAPTPFQQFVINWLNRSKIRSQKRNAAALLILLFWRESKQKTIQRILQLANSTKKKSSITRLSMARFRSADEAGGNHLAAPAVVGGALLSPRTPRSIAISSNKARLEVQKVVFKSIISQEHQMNVSSAHDWTEFQGLTRCVLTEQTRLASRINDLERLIISISEKMDEQNQRSPGRRATGPPFVC